MFYFIKTPFWLKKIYPSFVWNIATKEKEIFLSFDDGPHEAATPFVLDELKKYNAKATFFCIGKNVIAHPKIFSRIINEGHKVGNHTFNHLNGWKTKDAVYINDIAEAKKYIDSDLFRPPYGRITKFQAAILLKKISFKQKNLNQPFLNFRIIMWSILSGDFDENISPEKCLLNVTRNFSNGSVIVFHDSAKAFDRLKYALPKTLEFFTKQGFQLSKIM